MSKSSHPIKAAGLLATGLLGIPATARAAQPEMPPAPEPTPDPPQLEPRQRARRDTKYERLLAKMQIAKPESQPPQAALRTTRRQAPTQPIKQSKTLAIPTVEVSTSSDSLVGKSQRRGQKAPTLVATTKPENLRTTNSSSHSPDRWPEFAPESKPDIAMDEIVRTGDEIL